ncbi:MAG: helix-turn-helix domain-containing protein, partial [Pseudomonadota bacterium]
MDDTAYHHAVIGRAIDFIGERVRDQPSLEEVAEAVGLSPMHFQRVFSKWAGVSPKRYQQYLTLDHAKSLLQTRHTLLDTAYETGLSGTGRLHDLFLRWEAMSPGEYAKGGAGLTIRWDWVDTPFGEALAMATARGLCGLAFCTECGRAEAMADMRARWPQATYVQDHHMADLLHDVMSPTGDGKLHLIGAPFQIKVWEAL